VNYWVIGGGDAAGYVSANVSVNVSVAAWAVVSSTCLYVAGLLIVECIFPYACAETGTLRPEMEIVENGGAAVIWRDQTTEIFCFGGAVDFVSDPKKANDANGAGEIQNDCPGESGDAPEIGRVVPLPVRDLRRYLGCKRLAHEKAVEIVVACM